MGNVSKMAGSRLLEADGLQEALGFCSSLCQGPQHDADGHEITHHVFLESAWDQIWLLLSKISAKPLEI